MPRTLRSRGVRRKAIATLLRQHFRRGALMPHVYLNKLKLTSWAFGVLPWDKVLIKREQWQIHLIIAEREGLRRSSFPSVVPTKIQFTINLRIINGHSRSPQQVRLRTSIRVHPCHPWKNHKKTAAVFPPFFSTSRRKHQQKPRI